LGELYHFLTFSQNTFSLVNQGARGLDRAFHKGLSDPELFPIFLLSKAKASLEGDLEMFD
jgi:hypothetical protein